jgi:hypothetical protein
MSGNFAVVCHFGGAGQTWAIRAFIKDVPDIQRRYQLISTYLDGRRGEHSPFVGFRYVPDGIRVNGQSHPIVMMDWVPGVQLDRALEARIQGGQSLRPLIDAWMRLVAELEAMQVAHGDLQHGNILVDGDRILLVDYDGMFVPGMAGMPFSEHGHANYQHPKRSRHGFNANLDRFSATLILTAMKALEHDPSLWQRANMPNDNLLFLKKTDLLDPAGSPLFADLLSSDDAEVRMLAGVLRESLMTDSLPPSLAQLAWSRPTVVQSTTVTTGWWKASVAESNSGDSGSPRPAQPPIGSGWIRAYVGASAAEHPDARSSQAGQEFNPLLHEVPFVASFNRTYVHRSTCDWAHQISWRNLVGFESLDAALASGYKPCKTCKPHHTQPHLFGVDPGTVAPLTGNGTEPPARSPMKWDTSKAREHIQSTVPPATAPSPQHSARSPIVDVGSQVKLQYPNGDIVVIRVVRAGTLRSTLSHVPVDSPLGTAIKGKRVGDDIVYREMGKTFKFTICDVL